MPGPRTWLAFRYRRRGQRAPRVLRLVPRASTSAVSLGSARSSWLSPGLSLLWAALLVGEHIDALAIAATVAIVGCIAVAQRARIDAAPLASDAELAPAVD